MYGFKDSSFPYSDIFAAVYFGCEGSHTGIYEHQLVPFLKTTLKVHFTYALYITAGFKFYFFKFSEL